MFVNPHESFKGILEILRERDHQKAHELIRSGLNHKYIRKLSRKLPINEVILKTRENIELRHSRSWCFWV